VDTPDGVDIDGDVDMELGSEDWEDEEEEAERVEEVVDEKEEEDEDNGKEPRTSGQGEMVTTSVDNVDSMVDDQATVLPQQGQEMRQHTPQPQPPAPAPRPQTPEPPSGPRTLETHTLSRLEFLWLLMRQKPRPAPPTLREAEAAGNTLYVDVERQLLSQSAGADCLTDSPLPNIPLPTVPLPDVPLPDLPLSDVALPEIPLTRARPQWSVGKECTSPRFAEEAWVWVRVAFLSCEFPLLSSIHLWH